MYSRSSWGEPVDIFGPEPPPRDFLILLGVLFVNFSFNFFSFTRIIPEFLQLTPYVWYGALWQLVTYPFAPLGGSPFWFLITLLIVFMFGKEVRRYLGRRHFWQLLVWSAGTAALVAVVVQGLMTLAGGGGPLTFVLMQGDRMLVTILIAAFATLYGDAIIRLFFILPIRARSFLWLEIVFAFMGYLGTKDLAGFLGICTGVGVTYASLTGGLRRTLREWRLRLQRLFLETRLRHMRRRRGMRIVKPDEGGDVRRGPWVN